MKLFLSYSVPEGLIEEQPDIRGLATTMKPGKAGEIILGFTQRDALFFRLWIYTNLEIAEEQKTEIRHILGLLRRTLGVLKLRREGPRGYEVEYSLLPELKERDDLHSRLAEIFNNGYVAHAIADLLDIKDRIPRKAEAKIIEEAQEKGTHLQANGLLKAIAKHSGRDTKNPTLFYSEEEHRGSLSTREKYSRKAGEAALYLTKAYQERPDKSNEYLKIDKLSELARALDLSSAQEVKNILEHLGGYVHPFFERKAGGGIKIEYRQLFLVNVHYSQRVEEKYLREDPEVRGALQFLRNEPVDFIEVKPCREILDQINRKGLGSRVVRNALIRQVRGLTEGAYKTLAYFLSNKPKSQSIGEDKLYPKLGYNEEQLYKEGRKRINERIIASLQELLEEEHLESYSYDPDRKIYSITLSEKAAPRRGGNRASSKNIGA